MDNPVPNNNPGQVPGGGTPADLNASQPVTPTPQPGAPTTPPTPPQPGIPATPPPVAPPQPGAAAPPTPPQPATPAPQSTEVNEDDLLKQKLAALEMAIKTNNVPNIVSSIIDYAIAARSSDIHIEPETDQLVRIRVRIDGVLQIISNYQFKMHPAVVSRVKIISNLKIDEQRVPQDGRAEFTAKNPFTQEVIKADLRVSTLPTVVGEKIVMRIQDKTKTIPTFDDLGIKGNNRKYLDESLKNPNGVVLVSGPTGSGKTTTLYSSLKLLNNDDVNILTIEDPVEYQMEGLNQSQVHPDIEYTFASGLRAALRQDPDIIMIGEIRDYETIEIAIRAALTGHLVFSTIHTNSSVDTITRIMNMGVPGFLIAAALRTVIAQRLVRRICQDCKQEKQLEAHVLKDVKETLEKLHPSENVSDELKQNPIFFEGKGCDKCNNTGYKGRVGAYEIMIVKDELAEMIVKGASRGELLYTAMHQGMTTLKQSGIMLALEGETTTDEVYRIANSM